MSGEEIAKEKERDKKNFFLSIFKTKNVKINSANFSFSTIKANEKKQTVQLLCRLAPYNVFSYIFCVCVLVVCQADAERLVSLCFT